MAAVNYTHLIPPWGLGRFLRTACGKKSTPLRTTRETRVTDCPECQTAILQMAAQNTVEDYVLVCRILAQSIVELESRLRWLERADLLAQDRFNRKPPGWVDALRRWVWGEKGEP